MTSVDYQTFLKTIVALSPELRSEFINKLAKQTRDPKTAYELRQLAKKGQKNGF